jgi:hypothetical protein
LFVSLFFDLGAACTAQSNCSIRPMFFYFYSFFCLNQSSLNRLGSAGAGGQTSSLLGRALPITSAHARARPESASGVRRAERCHSFYFTERSMQLGRPVALDGARPRLRGEQGERAGRSTPDVLRDGARPSDRRQASWRSALGEQPPLLVFFVFWISLALARLGAGLCRSVSP